MKQLKFMLAAATAIGLATAAQAAAADTELSEENFNSYTEQQVVAGDGGIDGFTFLGTEGDNESAIVPDGEDDMALKVNTGTDPLLRMLDTKSRTTVNLTNNCNYLTIDTMVQFTVTPETDTVTPGLIDPELKDEDGKLILENNIESDKLLIYLQEKTVGETKKNVLTVWASSVQSGGDDDFGGGEDKFVPTPVEISGVQVDPNQWYRLQVKTYVENGIVLFSIKIGDTELASAEALYPSATQETKAFPSLLGKAATLTYVGFAGEGMVDDLVVTKNYDVSTIDFTFTWTTEGISSVTYTLGSVVGSPVTSGEGIAAEPGAKITIAVTPADWYALVDNPILEYTVPAEAGDPVSLDGLVKEVTAADLDVTVPAGTPAETTSAALAWAKAAGNTTDAVKSAANIVANYLLDVTDLTVEPKIEIASVDASTKPMTITAKVTDANGKTYEKVIIGDGAESINATIKYKAAATLEALKSATSKDAIEEGDQFVQVVVE